MKTASIILAAGQSKRMVSDLPKVLQIERETIDRIFHRCGRAGCERDPCHRHWQRCRAGSKAGGGACCFCCTG
ncbi:hypothetical protein SDC9_161660 [bioreactor metagenome]|uniref:MobA-like NTP transferase domain-containing protein n=1 Tax=bioreactor metagenome TaxID=1076179 RepID=A0A645FQ17_9ZZZZ